MNDVDIGNRNNKRIVLLVLVLALVLLLQHPLLQVLIFAIDIDIVIVVKSYVVSEDKLASCSCILVEVPIAHCPIVLFEEFGLMDRCHR